MPKGPSRLRAGLHHKKEARPHGPAKAEKATQSAQLGRAHEAHRHRREPGQGEAVKKPPPPTAAQQAVDDLYRDIRQRVEQARAQVVTQVNQALVLTYWHIGKAIKTQVVQASERPTVPACSNSWPHA
jgi:hypothetical protein